MNRSMIISASKEFEPGVRALLNSFDYYHPNTTITVYLLNHNLPEEFCQELINKFKFLKIIKLKSQFTDRAWACKIERFKFAGSLTGLVMMMDADLFICDNIDFMFDIAELGYIVGSSNGSNIRYTSEWRMKYGIDDIPIGVNYKTICSVPTVLDMGKHSVIWESIYKHKTAKKYGADFDLINIFMAKFNKLDKIIPIPSQQTTGVHHFNIKLDTRIRRIDDKLMTTDGLPVLMVHGKYWDKGWLNGLLRPMKSYARDREDILKGAAESKQIILDEFNKHLRGKYNGNT